MKYIILKKVDFENEQLISVLLCDEVEKARQEMYYKHDILDIVEIEKNETNRVEVLVKKYINHTINDIIKEW